MCKNSNVKKQPNQSCRRLGYASGKAARFLQFSVLQRMFREKNAEHLNKPLGGMVIIGPEIWVDKIQIDR
jgi:hypothetical protein